MTPYRKKKLKHALSLANQLSAIIEQEWNEHEEEFLGDRHFELETLKENLEGLINENL